MHMVSKRDFYSAELETMRISKNPTTVMTANGEVQRRGEATVYVKELEFFVPAMLHEETPAVLSLVKFCEDHGYTYHWTSGQKPRLTNNDKILNCQKANYVPFVVPGLSTSSSTSSSLAVDRTPTHKTHLCSTVCSQARTAHTTLGSRIALSSLCEKQVLSSGVSHVSSLVASPAFHHEHFIFFIHSSFYDTRTRSTIGTKRATPRTLSTSRTSPSSLSRQVAPSSITLA